MKFTALIAAAAMTTVVSAQQLAVSNPTVATIWKVGVPNPIKWSNNCANMGNASHAVGIELVQGDELSLAFIADLGKLDCSSTNVSHDVVIPAETAAGQYSLRILTLPLPSYSTKFTVASASTPSSSATAPPATTTTPPPKSAGSALETSVKVMMAGLAVAALQLAL